jgi:hypothetical protein
MNDKNILNELHKNAFLIKDLATLQVISDPLRLSIFHQITRDNLTGNLSSARQLSEQLKISQTKLYYHLKMLEQFQFIEVGEIRVVSGIQEKWYRITAPNLIVSDALLSNHDLLLQFTTSMFNQSKQEIGSSLHPPHTNNAHMYTSLYRKVNQLTPRQAQEFNQRLEKLVEEFSSQPDSGEGESLDTYVLFMSLYSMNEGQMDKKDIDPESK